MPFSIPSLTDLLNNHHDPHEVLTAYLIRFFPKPIRFCSFTLNMYMCLISFQGSMSTSNDRTNNTNPENVEVEYEAIENVRVSVDADNASRQTESASQIDTIPSTSPSSNVRAGSVSSQESTEDENQPLV